MRFQVANKSTGWTAAGRRWSNQIGAILHDAHALASCRVGADFVEKICFMCLNISLFQYKHKTDWSRRIDSRRLKEETHNHYIKLSKVVFEKKTFLSTLSKSP